MSSKDSAAKDAEGFLARWSRLKAGGGNDLPAPDEPNNAGHAAAAAGLAEQPAEDLPSLIELTKLPRIEDLTSGSDFAAFLQKGVPEELKNMALRKAWSLDPAIRDFVEVAENQYDWNTPGGAPGFGELNAGADMKQLLAQAIGEVSGEKVDPVRAEAETVQEDARPAEDNDAAGLRMAQEHAVAATPAPQMPLPPAAETSGARPEQLSPMRSRHGGALPRLPDKTA